MPLKIGSGRKEKKKGKKVEDRVDRITRGSTKLDSLQPQREHLKMVNVLTYCKLKKERKKEGKEQRKEEGAKDQEKPSGGQSPRLCREEAAPILRQMLRTWVAGSLLYDRGHPLPPSLHSAPALEDKGKGTSYPEGPSCSDSADGDLFFLPFCRQALLHPLLSQAHLVQNSMYFTLRVEQLNTLEGHCPRGSGAEAVGLLDLGSVSLSLSCG